MKKNIYITEDVAKELTEIMKPLSDLPQDIKNVLRNHKTSLGIHPAFPPEEEMPFDTLDSYLANINTKILRSNSKENDDYIILEDWIKQK